MEILQIDPEKVKDNPYQPRKGYSPKKVDEIASSIEQNGLLETPLGRRRNGDVELAFGHVRKRSFIKLKKKNPKKWPTMPVEIREISDREMVVFALEENLKRSDITPIDLARSVTKYFELFTDATETTLASKLGMTQGNISNMRRVMRLPDEILQKIDDGRIFFTMARELLTLEGLKAAGVDERYSRKEGGYKKIPKDSKWLMLDAVKGIATPGSEGRYGTHPATVEGMQRAIHDTVCNNFKPLGTSSDYGYYREEVLFNVEKAGCLKCEAMIKTHPTKNHACSWCTKPACWDKNQKTHKDQMAAAAKKKMEKDILQRATAAEKERQARVDISQEISPAEDIVDTIPEEEKGAAKKRIQQLKDVSPNYPCLTCLKVGSCDGTGVYSVGGEGENEVFACDDHMGKGDAKKVREKATVAVPPELAELAKEKAGSRAEVFDLNELRVGHYGSLKQGYALLDNELKHIDNPKECLETCTKGFHYAFDSYIPPYDRGERKATVSYVCTDPKCLSRKKAAFTRALHAAGQAKKKAEMAAIKQVVTETTRLDGPRMKVVVLSLITTSRSWYYADEKEIFNWFLNKLKVKHQKTGYGTADDAKAIQLITEAAGKLSEEELAKLIIEFSLMKLTYKGDVKEYKVLTTEALNWLGIGINIEKEKKDKVAVNKGAAKAIAKNQGKQRVK